MQTILGASGQIGRELASELKRGFTDDIRLVSRKPQQVNESDQLLSADLLDLVQAMRAVEGSQIVYLTVGLPMDTKLWVSQWPILMRNTIDACEPTAPNWCSSTIPTCTPKPRNRRPKQPRFTQTV